MSTKQPRLSQISARLSRLPGKGMLWLRGIFSRRQPEVFPIAYKLAIVLSLFISSGMVLLGLVIVTNQTQLHKDQMNQFGHTVVSQLADVSKELIMSDDLLSLMVVTSNLGADKPVIGSVIYSRDGNILASSGLVPGDEIIRLYSHAEENNGRYHTEWIASDQQGKKLDVVTFITPVRFQNVIAGHALVTFDRSQLEDAIHSTVTAIIVTTILLIMLAIYVSLHMGRRLSRPIHSLMEASKEITEGHYTYRIKERRNDEIGYLTEAFNRMASGLYEKTQVESAFSRYVSKSVAREILDNLDHIKLGGTRVDGTVLFADIVGFTSLSETISPEEVAKILNEYFSYITLASQMYSGTVDKYMGDCAMVVFGVPESHPQHKLQAIYCAVMIQKLIDRVNDQRIRENRIPVYFRIGVNSGNMLAGNMGASDRMQYTVVGESVNLASRLHDVAEKQQIIITENFYDDPDINWRLKVTRHRSIKLRGIKGKVSTYIVNDVIDLYKDKIEEQISEILKKKSAA